jgi:hypothetical protein
MPEIQIPDIETIAILAYEKVASSGFYDWTNPDDFPDNENGWESISEEEQLVWYDTAESIIAEIFNPENEVKSNEF